MKCTIFVVMFALAAVNASILPLAYHPLVLNPYAPHITLAQGIPGTVLAHHAVPVSYATVITHPHTLLTTVGGSHAIHTGTQTLEVKSDASGSSSSLGIGSSGDASSQSVVGDAKAIVAVPTATYIAQTRGGSHVAELPGHTESVVSQNLQPPAGTL